MKLPKSYDDITIEQYQYLSTFVSIINSTDTDFEHKAMAWTSILSYLTLEDSEVFETMHFDKLTVLTDQISFLLIPFNEGKVNETIIVNNQFYKGLTDITKGNYAQYSSIKTILSKGEDVTPNVHTLLGCIYAPVKLYSQEYDMLEVGREMKNAKVSQVLGLVFFYSRIFKNLMPIINDYLAVAESHLNQEKSLTKSMDGI